MFEAYRVAVRISLKDEVSSALIGLSKLFLTTDKHVNLLQKSIKNVAAGAATMSAGIAIAAPFISAIDKAASLQREMIGIQLATRGTTSEMDRMRATIEQVAGITTFSSIDVAHMSKTIATGTGLSAAQVTSVLPQYAKFADAQYLMKGTPAEKSVADAIRLAHTAGYYSAGALSSYLDLLTKASLIVPGDLGEVGHALKYSQGLAKNALGVGDNQMVLMTALLNRLGFAGSRGGTNLIAAMVRSIPGVFGSGLLSGRSGEALAAMGMVDTKGHSLAMSGGSFDTTKWVGLLGQYVHREFASHPEAIAREDILKNFQYAFGVQGGRVASLMSTPQALEQLRQIGITFANLPSNALVQGTFAQQSVWQQYQNAKTNFSSAMTELGWSLLPMATKALDALNGSLGRATEFIRNHQEAFEVFSKSMLAVGGALAVGGGIKVFAGALGGLKIAFNLLGAPRIVGAAGYLADAALWIGRVVAAGEPLGWVFMGIAGAATLIYRNWDAIWPLAKKIGFIAYDALDGIWKSTSTWLGKLADGFIGFFGKIIEWVKKSPLASFFTAAGNAAANQAPDHALAGPWGQLPVAGKAVGDWINRKYLDAVTNQYKANYSNEGHGYIDTVAPKAITVQVVSNTYVDGQKIASTVTKHQADALGAGRYTGGIDNIAALPMPSLR